jgi:outer membrane lipoprotein SlyB
VGFAALQSALVVLEGVFSMRKLILATTALTLTVPALPTAAAAQYRGGYQTQQTYSGPTWRGQDGRIYCKRPNGTTGIIVGAAAGALAGRAIDTHGSRATGTILGAAIGAVVGRSVHRDVKRCA